MSIVMKRVVGKWADGWTSRIITIVKVMLIIRSDDIHSDDCKSKCYNARKTVYSHHLITLFYLFKKFFLASLLICRLFFLICEGAEVDI
jgi:hypothetical protein